MPINSFSRDSFQLQLEETLGALLLTSERFFQKCGSSDTCWGTAVLPGTAHPELVSDSQFKGVVPNETASRMWGPQGHHTLTNWLQSQGLP